MSDHIEKAASGDWRDQYGYEKKPPKSPEERAADRERALAIWHARKPLKGSPAEHYLRRRYIRPDILLWPPEGWPETICWSDDAVLTPKAAKPAMICAINDAKTGLVCGIHRIFFGRDGNVELEPDGKKNKRSLGAVWGNAARLSHWPDPDGRWGIAEGIEGALAATLLTRIPVWSAIFAGNMVQITPPSWARDIVIFCDHDKSATGMRRSMEALAAWKGRAGIERIRILTHKRLGADVADALQEAPYAA